MKKQTHLRGVLHNPLHQGGNAESRGGFLLVIPDGPGHVNVHPLHFFVNELHNPWSKIKILYSIVLRRGKIISPVKLNHEVLFDSLFTSELKPSDL